MVSEGYGHQAMVEYFAIQMDSALSVFPKLLHQLLFDGQFDGFDSTIDTKFLKNI